MKGFDVVGYYESQDGPAYVTACGDRYYTVSGDNITIKKRAPWLLGVANFGVSTPVGGHLEFPKIAAVPYDFSKGSLFTYNVPRVRAFSDYLARPYPLMPGEQMRAYTLNDTNEISSIVAFLGSEPIPKASVDSVRPTYRTRMSGSSTVTAGAWTLCTMTLDHPLPVGQYYIVGMNAFGDVTTGAYGENIAARLVLKNGTDWVPGVLMQGGSKLSGYGGFAVEDDTISYQKWPRMDDIWMDHDEPPDIEVLSTDAIVTQDVFLELVGPTSIKS